MTKKDFQAFASAIKELRKSSSIRDDDENEMVTVLEVEEMCANIFARDNSLFNHERFHQACKGAKI